MSGVTQQQAIDMARHAALGVLRATGFSDSVEIEIKASSDEKHQMDVAFLHTTLANETCEGRAQLWAEFEDTDDAYKIIGIEVRPLHVTFVMENRP